MTEKPDITYPLKTHPWSSSTAPSISASSIYRPWSRGAAPPQGGLSTRQPAASACVASAWVALTSRCPRVRRTISDVDGQDQAGP